VDYVGVFRDLQKALAIYGSGAGGRIKEGESPVRDKSALVEQLEQAIAEATSFCAERGIDTSKILTAQKFEKVKLVGDAVDAILAKDEFKKRFLILAASVARLYKAILPDPAATELHPACVLFAVLAEKIRSKTGDPDISSVMHDVEGVLDSSIAAEGYVIRDEESAKVDLSKIDFEKLKKHFARAHKHTEVERLRNAISKQLTQMVCLNRSRMDYLKKFQDMIEEYNAGSSNADTFFENLVAFVEELNEEEKRSIAENLSEEELAILDILTKPEMKLSPKEGRDVKKVARQLLETLKREKLVLDWRKFQQSRAAVRQCIEEVLDRLPRAYSKDLYQTKCAAVYGHVYDAYFGEGRSVYSRLA
jgi:type I restriction enzyme, R subunit